MSDEVFDRYMRVFTLVFVASGTILAALVALAALVGVIAAVLQL